MNTIVPGHEYILRVLGGEKNIELSFVDRGHGNDRPGTTNQEVLRVLINRVEFMDKEKPWDGNKKILRHLRMALVLHEARHLERLVEREELKPECLDIGQNGHFIVNGVINEI